MTELSNKLELNLDIHEILERYNEKCTRWQKLGEVIKKTKEQRKRKN